MLDNPGADGTKGTNPSSEVFETVIEKSEGDLQESQNRLQEQREEGRIVGSEGRTDLESDPESVETQKVILDATIAHQLEKIRRQEDAVEVLRGRQKIMIDGEVSRFCFGDVIWNYETTFRDTDGKIVRDTENFVLVPSALVDEKILSVKVAERTIDVSLLSPESPIGRKIITSSI